MESEGGILSEVLIQTYKETLPFTSAHCPGTVPTGASLTSTAV